MSLNENSIKSSLNLSNWKYRIRVYCAIHPEWWVWLFSGFIWLLLIGGSFYAVIDNQNVSNNLITCLPVDLVDGEDLSILKQPSAFEAITDRLLKSGKKFKVTDESLFKRDSN